MDSHPMFLQAAEARKHVAEEPLCEGLEIAIVKRGQFIKMRNKA